MDNNTPTPTLVELTKQLNAAGYAWAMVNYVDGTFYAVVRPTALAEWIGDELGYNMAGESFSTPEEALSAAMKEIHLVQALIKDMLVQDEQ
jgi:hypothetical protein